MKVWKMAGCLVLLCAIVCGCVIIGKGEQISDPQYEGVGENGEGTAPSPEQSAPAQDASGAGQGDAGGSAAAGKTYSTGLYFRSNGDGTCALAGMGSCTAACVLIPPQSPAGDTVSEILPYALAGSIVGSVEIPATVTAVTAISFAGCERLAYVRVEAGNPALLEFDGALYSKDGSTLLYCPAARNARELQLHSGLQRIAAAAFASCPALDVVHFAGNTAAWHSITVGDENNALYAASLRFGS